MSTDDKAGPGISDYGQPSPPGQPSTPGQPGTYGYQGSPVPEFGHPGQTNQADQTNQTGYEGHQGPHFTPSGQLGGYDPADFPAPQGVLPVSEQRSAVAVATRPRRRLVPLIAAASLSAVIGAGAGIGSYAYFAQDNLVAAGSSPISVTTVPAARTPVLNGTISAAAAAIEPSVVTITVQAGQGGDIGSGVVLDNQGHILTNNHVVEAAAASTTNQNGGSAASVTVTFNNGTTAKATVLGTSATNDLAVIKVDGVSDLHPAVFAKSGSLEVGQGVVAAGAPLGLSASITSGIVSNTARPVRSGSNNDAVYLAVQTDAAINPGNSGGPLVNLNGDVVGINSSIASTGSGADATSQSGNIGIGFAIPADVAARVAADLIANGSSTNAALGVSVGGTDSTLATDTGVALQSVTADGSAAKAGLQKGDVVTQVDAFHTTTADGLIAATRFYAPGTKVTVTYTRGGGSPQTVDVTLGRA